MLQIQGEHSLTIHVVNTSNSQTNDIKTFTDVVKICKAESERAGFKNLFDDKQKKLISDIHEQIMK